MLGCRMLKHPIGLGQSCRSGLLSAAEMPEHAPTDNGRQVDFGCQTCAVLLIGEDIDGQRQPTPGQDRHQTVVAECTDQAVDPSLKTIVHALWDRTENQSVTQWSFDACI